MSITDVPQIKKKQYRNNTSGWIGVVTLDHLGQEIGVNVEPNGGTIWLSDAEAILTARAPQKAEHNPFIEQEYRFRDANGQTQYVRMAPISLVSADERDIYGSDRPVPGITDDAQMRAHTEQAAREGTAAGVTEAAAARTAEIEREAEIEGSWVGRPTAPGVVLPGELRGTNEPAPRPTTSSPAVSPTPPPQAPVLSSAPVTHSEETAAREPEIAEETGAATNGHAEVHGEYASIEETGTDQLGGDHDNTEGLIA